jgi:hypothetical protein
MSATELEQLRAEVARLAAEVVDAHAQLRHLTSGQAELTVRRLAVVDEHGVERIVAETFGGEGEAVLTVRSRAASVFMYAAPTWGKSTDDVNVPHVADHATLGIGEGDTDLRLTCGRDDTNPSGRSRIEFEEKAGLLSSNSFVRTIDIYGVH